MAEAQEVTGPDLRRGVPLGMLVEGQPFVGHADGEAVLLVRTGQEVRAVGATCTHYGGPLGEGVVTGAVVRCPWHHACFSLDTGEAVAAPALNPLACWRTRVEDGVVTVVERVEREPLWDGGRKAAGPSSVVIIGAGAAGSAAAEMLRREGYAGPVTLVDPDGDAPYDRPNLSKDYLAGNAPEEWIPLRPPGFHEEHGIARVHARAESIDVAGRRVLLSNGGALEYGALLLATGASPIRLKVPGAQLPHVHLLRSLADCRRLIAAAENAQRVVIAGASFIGMEAAASLRARNVEVTVVAPEEAPFARTLGAELGGFLWSLHEEHGVRFALGSTLAEIREREVVLDDGSVLPADLVLLGVGVRPLVDLAATAGLDTTNGVEVDAYLETRVPGIFAAGDIARFPDPRTGEATRIEHWVVAQRQGQTAARNILGRRVPFDSVPYFWTHQYDVRVSYTGHAKQWDREEKSGDAKAHDFAVSYVRDGAVLAVATIGRDRENLESELRLEKMEREMQP